MRSDPTVKPDRFALKPVLCISTGNSEKDRNGSPKAALKWRRETNQSSLVGTQSNPVIYPLKIRSFEAGFVR
ncbi:hypothetical protein KIN_41190 [Litoreibacter roseus]|uniref:Uncharacterized protein n=1 Tax=Litoreibacter roseus TaxID=2601869 RepID=A0A6N6JLT7_9RHOB|nr:hypothetical protein KIN_41190 [Litoreibacter roseus]